MGGDKALVEVEGRPLVARVAAVLGEAGIAPVVVVGGADALAAAAGTSRIDDLHPGDGPLGGIVTALRWAEQAADDAGVPAAGAAVVVAPCDQPDLTGGLVRDLVAALERAQVAVPMTPDGRRHPLPTAWRLDAADVVARRFARGDRRADAAHADLVVASVAADPWALADLDTPEQVAVRRQASP